MTFADVIYRARVERWPFVRVIEAIEALPEPERTLARAVTREAIAEELDSRNPHWREQLQNAKAL